MKYFIGCLSVVLVLVVFAAVSFYLSYRRSILPALLVDAPQSGVDVCGSEKITEWRPALELGKRLRDRFPVGTDEGVVIDELLREGFHLSGPCE